jgi:hypothetical protein
MSLALRERLDHFPRMHSFEMSNQVILALEGKKATPRILGALKAVLVLETGVFLAVGAVLNR